MIPKITFHFYINADKGFVRQIFSLTIISNGLVKWIGLNQSHLAPVCGNCCAAVIYIFTNWSQEEDARYRLRPKKPLVVLICYVHTVFTHACGFWSVACFMFQPCQWILLWHDFMRVMIARLYSFLVSEIVLNLLW